MMFVCWYFVLLLLWFVVFFFSSRRRHTRCALVTGVQTCALPICSFVLYGPYWAQAATAPSSMHKGWMTEGGTRVPAFITYAGFQRQGAVGHAFGNVMDIVPTIMEAADAPVVDVVSG